MIEFLSFKTNFVVSLWLWTTIALCLIAYYKWARIPDSQLLRREANFSVGTFIYVVLFAVIMGLRSNFASDTFNYAHAYFMIESDSPEIIYEIDTNEEWLWDLIMNLFISFRLSVHDWLFAICCGYIGFMYLGIRRLFPTNQWIALLFCISSFSFISYSYNGIRNGMACSLIIWALSYYVNRDFKDFCIGLFLSFLAFGIHRTTALPTIAIWIALLFKSDIKWAIWLWVSCIILSLIVGNSLQFLIASMGFDERLQDYGGITLAQAQAENVRFSHTGFRWDFILYSGMPILLAYIVNVKNHILDKKYIYLINTYIVANAFWVIMNQAAYSNRFAYLSWFMYPIVIAYPLLTIPIWKNQDRIIMNILLAYLAFTVFMNFIY